MENKIAHLNMIQGIVTRMANNSFALKGWAVTLVAALFALSGKDANQFYYLVTYVPIVVFWFLDAYYLDQERRFRKLYEKVIRIQHDADIDFSMVPPFPPEVVKALKALSEKEQKPGLTKDEKNEITKAKKKVLAKYNSERFFEAFKSVTIMGFYLPLALVTAGIIAITALI